MNGFEPHDLPGHDCDDSSATPHGATDSNKQHSWSVVEGQHVTREELMALAQFHLNNANGHYYWSRAIGMFGGSEQREEVCRRARLEEIKGLLTEEEFRTATEELSKNWDRDLKRLIRECEHLAECTRCGHQRLHATIHWVDSGLCQRCAEPAVVEESPAEVEGGKD